jgi:hypothetical protein
MRSNRRAVTCSFKIGSSRVQARGRLVGVTARGLVGRSVCKSARSLVVPDQNPNVPVYLQPAALFLPSQGVEGMLRNQ